MTVSTDDNAVSYTGNGVTTAFSFPRLFYDESHLNVYLDGVLQSSGYVVTGVGTTTGFVTFSTAPTNGVVVLIERVVPYRQETDFENFDGNPSDVTENQFDLIVMQTQQLRDISNRALVVPVGDTATSLELPDASTRASSVLFFDENGTPTTTSDADSVSAAAAAASAAAAQAAQAAAEVAQAAAEAASVGIKWRPQVKAATTANIVLSGEQTIDGVAVVAADRVLVKDQTTTSQNGIYVCAVGAWSRATDADSWAELVSLAVSVEQGSSNADTQWICTSDSGGTLGSTAVGFASFLTTPKDSSVSYVKVDPNAVATRTQILSATASKLVDAATLNSVLPKIGTPITASGTSVDFTSIPAGVRKVTVTLSGLSTNGTSDLLIQIGDSGGIENSGYSSSYIYANSAGGAGSTNSTAGFIVFTSTAGAVISGAITLFLHNSGSFTWSASGFTSNIDGATIRGCSCAGAKSLSAELDRVRVTTVGGVNTFDAGSINIMYE